MSETNGSKQCSQAGYLPVPLRCVPPESLSVLNIYLSCKGTYSLYSAIDNSFGLQDVERLLDSKVEYVYVSVRDHQAYYETVEHSIDDIISDPNIQQQKKSEILYATSLELSNQLLSVPPGKDEVKRASNMAAATVNMILQDKGAFGRLYEVFNHDFYTASHVVNVCGLTVMLAQKMGMLDTNLLQQLGTGGLLHDIGKIFVPNHILNTPKKLTNQEFDKIKTHVDLGCQHLEKVMDMLPPLRSVVAEHHERMDGSGYPRGLKNDEISPLGRLSGIVDSFDAMTSVRPYREHTFSVAETLQRLEDDTPDKYDPEMFRTLAKIVENVEKDPGNQENATGAKTTKVKPNITSLPSKRYLQYFFRVKVNVQKVKKENGQIKLMQSERVLSHKLSCMGFAFMSNRYYDWKENVLVSSPQLEKVGLNNLLAKVVSCQQQLGGNYTIETRFPKNREPELIARIKDITPVREMSMLIEN